MKVPDPRTRDIQLGREAYARKAWADAYEALSRADRVAPLGSSELELLAWSASLRGDDDELIRMLERVYQLSINEGAAARAANAAFWLGFRLMGLGEAGRAGGWFARAQRLAEAEGRECTVQGYLLLPVAFRQMAAGEHELAFENARRAADIGKRAGDRDLVAFAQNLQGRSLILQERTDEGLALLDEVMLEVTTGELSPLITGFVYCAVISSCQKVYALKRAREWTSALADWCQGQPQLVTFTGSCLVHRSEIMQLGGAWPEAFEEARLAGERFTRPADQAILADALYQQAEIHRLRGELTQAEQAYRRASQLGREPQPGLALLRLAEDRADAAVSAIRRVIGATTDRLERARLLPAYVEILLAAGELDEARRAGEELERLSERIGSEILAGIAAHACGAIRLAEGDALGAVEPLRRAFQVWQQADAPYLAARIRVLIGSACGTLGDEDGMALELDAARAEFERLGALPDLARVDALRKKPTGERPEGLSTRELEVLRHVASGKTNKAIAKDLGLSEKTVDRHVSNIFTKLDVPSRAAATAYAFKNGLI